jgi:hypothetical protein
VLFMSAESEIWPAEMFEPLSIGIVFPFLPVRPWQVCGAPKMATRNLSSKLCEQMWSLRMWCGE